MATLKIIGALLLVFVIIAHGSPIGGDGEAEELIAYADESEGSAAEPHFVGVQLKPNPHKRSAYRVRESSGLRSHFSAAGSARIEDAPFYVHENSGIDGSQDSKVDDFVIFNSVPRSKRDAAVSDKSDKDSSPDDDARAEPLPSAEAQTMETGYNRRARSRLSDDSMAQASGTAEPGLRRVPRVNFITQPRTIDESPEHRDLKASNANVDPMYRRPPYDSYMPMPVHPQYSRNMGRGRFFDGNMGGGYGQTYGQSYDRYDQRDYMGTGGQRYDPYYYSQRYNQMGGGGYANNNYNQGYYSDRRGYPDGYAQMRDPYAGAQGGGAYMNDVNYMGYPNRRVIYYAHLPEIVRPTSPYGESRGQYSPNGNRGGYEGYGYDDPYYNSRPQYMDDYNYRYNRDMNQYGMAPLPQPPPSVIYSNNNHRIPERDRDRDQNKDTKNKDGNDSKTQTISSNIRIKDSPNKGYNNGNNYDSDNSRQGPSSSSDFMQPHYRME